MGSVFSQPGALHTMVATVVSVAGSGSGVAEIGAGFTGCSGPGWAGLTAGAGRRVTVAVTVTFCPSFWDIDDGVIAQPSRSSRSSKRSPAASEATVVLFVV